MATKKQKLKQALLEERAGIAVSADPDDKVQLYVPRKPANEEEEEDGEEEEEADSSRRSFGNEESSDDDFGFGDLSKYGLKKKSATTAVPAPEEPRTEHPKAHSKHYTDAYAAKMPVKGPSAQDLMRKPRAAPGPKAKAVLVTRSKEVEEARSNLPIIFEEQAVRCVCVLGWIAHFLSFWTLT